MKQELKEWLRDENGELYLADQAEIEAQRAVLLAMRPRPSPLRTWIDAARSGFCQAFKDAWNVTTRLWPLK